MDTLEKSILFKKASNDFLGTATSTNRKQYIGTSDGLIPAEALFKRVQGQVFDIPLKHSPAIFNMKNILLIGKYRLI